METSILRKASTSRAIELNDLQLTIITALVNRKVTQFARSYGLQRSDQEDLRQEGLYAALQMVDGYDPAVGTLEAYLSIRVNFAMLRALEEVRSGGITGDFSAGIMEEDVHINPWSRGARTLSGPLADDPEFEGGSHPVSVIETIPDDEPVDLETAKLTDDVVSALDRIPLGAKNILVRYYGLAGDRPQTVRELAKHYRTSAASAHRRILSAQDALKAVVVSTTSAIVTNIGETKP